MAIHVFANGVTIDYCLCQLKRPGRVRLSRHWD